MRYSLVLLSLAALSLSACVSAPASGGRPPEGSPAQPGRLPGEGPGQLDTVPREIRARAEGLISLWRQRARDLGAELTWSWRRRDFDEDLVTYIVTGRWMGPELEEHRTVTLTQHRPTAEALGPEQLLGPGFLAVLPGRLSSALSLPPGRRAPARRAAYLALAPEPEGLRLWLDPEELGRVSGPWVEVFLSWPTLGPEIQSLGGL